MSGQALARSHEHDPQPGMASAWRRPPPRAKRGPVPMRGSVAAADSKTVVKKIIKELRQLAQARHFRCRLHRAFLWERCVDSLVEFPTDCVVLEEWV